MSETDRVLMYFANLQSLMQVQVTHTFPARMAAQETFLVTLFQEERYSDSRRLLRYDHQVYSQGGEDGILQEIFRRIGETDRFFVEAGVGNGLENCTVFLLSQGWRGAWVEGDASSAQQICHSFATFLNDGRLHFTPLLDSEAIMKQALACQVSSEEIKSF